MPIRATPFQMIKIKAQADLSAAQRYLIATSDKAKQAAARALNRVADQTKGQAAKAISAGYNITQAKVRERIKVRKAFARGDLTATVSVESKFGRRATNLITFGAKQVKAGGVRVKIRRDRPPIHAPRWFILTNLKTGGTFVARRVGKGRKDIKSVTTIDVGQMFNSKRVNLALQAMIRSKFPPEFERQLRFALSR